MDEMIREEEFLGNRKVLVGSNKLDLVLEAFGNIYVKTGDSTKTLDELLKSIGSKTTEEVVKTMTILDTYANLVSLVYPGDGMFIYVKSNTTLYLTSGGEYLPIISTVGTDSIEYVKKTGDTMTGSLEINTNKVPLIINSKKRVDNLNVQYLDGQLASDFTNKAKNEAITGSWNFKNSCTSEGKWTFDGLATHNEDIIANKSLGSKLFASGFAGYGWRLDGTTNTLTIDYLVVRKAMQIYELVVNKITATNGSLWVTNCATLDNTQLITEVSDFVSMDTTLPETWQNGSYYIIQIDTESSWMLLYLKDKNSLQSLITEVGGDLSLILSTTKPTAFTDEQWSLFQTYINVRALHTNYSELSNATFEFISTTPLTNYNTYGRLTGTNLESRLIYSYYFTGNFYYIEDTNSEYSVLQVGDIIRCQKFENNSIKYYDAVIVRCFGSCKYIIRLVESVFDVYTEISYNDDGSINESTTSANSTLYNKNTESNLSASLTSVSDEDDIVQVGNIYNEKRQGSVYITSSDDNAPYLQCMDGVNIPDFSVVYTTPQYLVSSNGDYYYTTVTITNELTEYTIQTTKPTNASLPVIERENWSIVTENSILKYKKDTTTETSFNYLYTTKSTVKVRLGKLEGIYNSLFGTKQPKGYGLYCDNVYMTGEFYLNNGTSIVEFSKEQILLQFKDAGLTIGELTEDGVTKSYIDLVADQLRIYSPGSTSPTALFKDGKILADFLEISGNIQIGTDIYSDSSVYNNTLPELETFKDSAFNHFEFDLDYTTWDRTVLNNAEILKSAVFSPDYTAYYTYYLNCPFRIDFNNIDLTYPIVYNKLLESDGFFGTYPSLSYDQNSINWITSLSDCTFNISNYYNGSSYRKYKIDLITRTSDSATRIPIEDYVIKTFSTTNSVSVGTVLSNSLTVSETGSDSNASGSLDISTFTTIGNTLSSGVILTTETINGNTIIGYVLVKLYKLSFWDSRLEMIKKTLTISTNNTVESNIDSRSILKAIPLGFEFNTTYPLGKIVYETENTLNEHEFNSKSDSVITLTNSTTIKDSVYIKISSKLCFAKYGSVNYRTRNNTTLTQGTTTFTEYIDYNVSMIENSEWNTETKPFTTTGSNNTVSWTIYNGGSYNQLYLSQNLDEKSELTTTTSDSSNISSVEWDTNNNIARYPFYYKYKENKNDWLKFNSANYPYAFPFAVNSNANCTNHNTCYVNDYPYNVNGRQQASLTYLQDTISKTWTWPNKFYRYHIDSSDYKHFNINSVNRTTSIKDLGFYCNYRQIDSNGLIPSNYLFVYPSKLNETRKNTLYDSVNTLPTVVSNQYYGLITDSQYQIINASSLTTLGISDTEIPTTDHMIFAISTNAISPITLTDKKYVDRVRYSAAVANFYNDGFIIYKDTCNYFYYKTSYGIESVTGNEVIINNGVSFYTLSTNLNGIRMLKKKYSTTNSFDSTVPSLSFGAPSTTATSSVELLAGLPSLSYEGEEDTDFIQLISGSTSTTTSILGGGGKWYKITYDTGSSSNFNSISSF